MHRTSTPLKKKDLLSSGKKGSNEQELQPGAETIEKILQFAASYRAEKIAANRFVDIILN